MKKTSNVSECINNFIEEMKTLSSDDSDVTTNIQQNRSIKPTYVPESDEFIYEVTGPTTYVITVTSWL